MKMTQQYAAVVLEPSNLEDPAIFADLEDSGLLTISDECLKIGQVLGAKLVKTVDALMPITAADLDAVIPMEGVEEAAPAVEEAPVADVVAPVATIAPVAPVAPVATAGQTVKIHIGEGRDINLEIPLGVAAQMGVVQAPAVEAAAVAPVAAAEVAAPAEEIKLLRSLKKNHYKKKMNGLSHHAVEFFSFC